ncbi:hypothetical protein [Krasilnikovia sp. MM14-A1259]|uniref:hypothetical protein n=1 Tax=Krasilnikovia sp. MM14-A1259 TaxID=3373539 RepID=UPI0038006521
MSDTSVIPGSLAIRNLFEDLLGREVAVSSGNPLGAADLPTATIAIYTDASQQMYAVLAMQLGLAANAGAALGLLPAGAAEDSIEMEKLLPNIAENVFELCNVLSSVFSNVEGAPRVKLYQVIYPGMDLPNDARAQLLALGKRLDLDIEVARYGKGTLSLSIA